MTKTTIDLVYKYNEYLDMIINSEELKGYRLSRSNVINLILGMHLEGFEIRQQTIKRIAEIIDIPFTVY